MEYYEKEAREITSGKTRHKIVRVKLNKDSALRKTNSDFLGRS
jgi:hypothetical protein